MSSKLKITLVRSPIGYNRRQRKTLNALGLRKISSSVTHTGTPEIKGMINAVKHLVAVEETDN